MLTLTRSTTLDLCVGFGSADVTTHAVLITTTNHSLLKRKMPIFHCLQISKYQYKCCSCWKDYYIGIHQEYVGIFGK